MTAIHLHHGPFGLLKRYTRSQFPTVKHSHILEALSSALGAQTWAALNLEMQAIPPFAAPGAARYRIVSTEALLTRLLELGYVEASHWRISFESLQNGTEIVTDAAVAQTTTHLPPLDRSRDRATLERLFAQWDQDNDVRKMLIELVVARAPGSDGSTDMKSTITLDPDTLATTRRHRNTAPHEQLDEKFPPVLLPLYRDVVEIRRDNMTVSFQILQSIGLNPTTGVLTYSFNAPIREALFALSSRG